MGRNTAGCGVPDTTPAPEIKYKHAQGSQKGLTATKISEYILPWHRLKKGLADFGVPVTVKIV